VWLWKNCRTCEIYVFCMASQIHFIDDNIPCMHYRTNNIQCLDLILFRLFILRSAYFPAQYSLVLFAPRQRARNLKETFQLKKALLAGHNKIRSTQTTFGFCEGISHVCTEEYKRTRTSPLQRINPGSYSPEQIATETYSSISSLYPASTPDV
jgi:hypothetical protein